ncbi:MAG: tRNA pseudouridine(38-40) synthase TruA [Deltaproteobacteria bacterium]|nr:tRNA pseudouridine(38-40) synthase TruA [Deltaproteobacteria bacterium]
METVKDIQQGDELAYRLDLSYIGTRYSGFQSQSAVATIQDELEKALKILLGHAVRIRGASRTDSGVHAQHQVAVFRTSKPFSRQWLSGLNALTPGDIGITALAPVPAEFDPIIHSTGKAYRYRLWKGKCFSPFIRPYVWEVSEELCDQQLAHLGQAFVGLHDFGAFCNRDSDAKSTVREIYGFHVETRGPMTEIWVSGRGFLKQMIRIMVGTLCEGSRKGWKPEDIQRLLQPGMRREHAGQTAPAKGLCLVRVFFSEPLPVPGDLIQAASAGFCQAIPGNHPGCDPFSAESVL